MTARHPKLDDPTFWDDFFAATAETMRSGREVAADFGVPYTTLWDAIDRDPALKDRYKAALRSQAGLHAAKIGSIMERLENPGMDEDGMPLPPMRPDTARVLMDGHKWLASKKDRETFGDDRQPLVQVNFDTAGLAELRRLAGSPVPKLEDGRIIDAEFAEAKPAAPSLDDLLE